MRTISRRLKKLIEDEEKTMARIAELQDFLKEIREARKKEEDLEIVRSIRSMKLGARDLFDLLTAIQDGNLSDELREQLLAAGEDGEEENLSDSSGGDRTGRNAERTEEEIREDKGSDPEHDEEGAESAPESEENNDDRYHN